MVKQDIVQTALVTSLRYLSPKARSAFEIRKRLRLGGYDRATTDTVIQMLIERGLLNDKLFADTWCQNRFLFRPRSAWLVNRELRAKGISKQIADEAVESINDMSAAYKAGSVILNRIDLSDHNRFVRKMYGYLARRGFGRATIRKATSDLWDNRCRS